MFGGNDGGMDFSSIMKMVKSPKKRKEIFIESGLAGALADLMNHHAMDMKTIAKAEGIEMETSMMTEERAAEIISELVSTLEYDELLDTANQMNEQREAVLDEVVDSEERDRLNQAKVSVSYLPVKFGGYDNLDTVTKPDSDDTDDED